MYIFQLVDASVSDEGFKSDTNFSFCIETCRENFSPIQFDVTFYSFFLVGMYDMLGNAWEWVSDEFKDNGRETKYVLRGGSYIDTADGKHNHKVTVTTRYAKPF